MNALVAFLRPISFFLGAGLPSLTFDMAAGRTPIPQDMQWLVPTLAGIMIALLVGIAQSLSTMTAAQTYQQIIDGKDEQITLLLALVRQDTAHAQATINNLPTAASSSKTAEEA